MLQKYILNDMITKKLHVIKKLKKSVVLKQHVKKQKKFITIFVLYIIIIHA